MAHKTTKILSFSIILILTILISSCYNDKAELLALETDCDTTLVTFNLSVAPIIQTHCQSCHSGGAPGGNILLNDYNSIKASAVNGSLSGSINHKSGFSAMPKGGNKLSNCDIRKIEIWISKGTPNN